MHAYLAVALAVALALAAPALALPRDRLGYEREIDTTNLNQVPKLLNSFVLSDEYLASQKNKGNKLITRYKPDEPVAYDNVILESNIVTILRPDKKRTENEAGSELVRRRRGYNLENVRVPARYPYLPVPRFNRFRRWG